MSTTREVADFVAGLKYTDLTPRADAIQRTKDHVLDQLGTIQIGVSRKPWLKYTARGRLREDAGQQTGSEHRVLSRESVGGECGVR